MGMFGGSHLFSHLNGLNSFCKAIYIVYEFLDFVIGGIHTLLVIAFIARICHRNAFLLVTERDNVVLPKTRSKRQNSVVVCICQIALPMQ